MRINVTTRNEDGSVAFTGQLNAAEVSSLLQYSVNNLMALGFVFDMQDIPEDDDVTNRIKAPTGAKYN